MVRLATSNTEHSAVLNARAPQPSTARTDDQDRRFSLTHALQTSLELEEVLEIFFSGVQDFLSLDGLSYQCDASRLDIKLGDIAKHNVNYSLSVKDNSLAESESLGSLTFRRHNPFLESELAVLEMLVGVLHYPLKNALRYQEAIVRSMRDPLTGIGNRLAMDACFMREFKLAQRQDHVFSVLLVDLDHFKNVNDTFGHSSGDVCLLHVVNIIRGALRDTDQIFRFGGEEFIILLDQTAKTGAKRIAERIRSTIQTTPVALKDGSITCTVSIGSSAFSGEQSTDTLFEQADHALYHAKQNGRNRVSAWEDMPPERGMDRALTNDNN